MAGKLSVVPIDESHAELLAEFFRSTWSPDATAEDVVASLQRSALENPSEPGVAPPTFAAIQGDRIIGYCSSLPLRLWSNGQEHAAYWAKGLMVLPEFRGGPIGFHVLSALTKSRPLLAAVTVAEGSKRLFGALGYKDYGAIPNLVRRTSFKLALEQIRPSRLPTPNRPLLVAFKGFEMAQAVGVAALGGWIADAVSSLALRPRHPDALHFRVSDRLPGESLDALWSRSRPSIGAAPTRAMAVWQARYDRDSNYRFVLMERLGDLTGVAILKKPRELGDPRLAGLRMASISDLLIAPEDPDLTSLLHATEQQAAALGAGAVILSVSDRRVVQVARRHGYMQRPGNIHFFLRSSLQAVEWPADLGDWWLTRGDGESDASF